MIRLHARSDIRLCRHFHGGHSTPNGEGGTRRQQHFASIKRARVEERQAQQREVSKRQPGEVHFFVVTSTTLPLLLQYGSGREIYD